MMITSNTGPIASARWSPKRSSAAAGDGYTSRRHHHIKRASRRQFHDGGRRRNGLSRLRSVIRLVNLIGGRHATTAAALRRPLQAFSAGRRQGRHFAIFDAAIYDYRDGKHRSWAGFASNLSIDAASKSAANIRRRKPRCQLEMPRLKS